MHVHKYSSGYRTGQSIMVKSHRSLYKAAT